MKLFRDPDSYDLRRYAVVCWMFSLPFHYVFWVSVYHYLRHGGYASPSSIAVVLAMGVAALGLGYFGLALYRYPNSALELFLPSWFLYVCSAVLAANAIYQLVLPHNLWFVVESLVTAAAAFLLARRRGRRDA
jgi:hypothetical protein